MVVPREEPDAMDARDAAAIYVESAPAELEDAVLRRVRLLRQPRHDRV